jgi:hypothetical protein
MAGKGQPKSGGRRPGTPNRATVARGQQMLELLTRTKLPNDPNLPVTDRPSALELVERIMWARYDAGDHVGALTAASVLLPYRFPRLSSSDLRVRHTFAAVPDEELANEMRALEARMRAVPQIEGEAIEAG